MSTYMGVTNFQNTVRFLAHPVELSVISLLAVPNCEATQLAIS